MIKRTPIHVILHTHMHVLGHGNYEVWSDHEEMIGRLKFWYATNGVMSNGIWGWVRARVH